MSENDHKPKSKDVQDLYIPDRVTLDGEASNDTVDKPKVSGKSKKKKSKGEVIVNRFDNSDNQKKFVWLLAFSAFFIATCAAYFSVRGIALLFAGSMIPVAIMASSLELGKLMTASFLYRKWGKCNMVMKTYLSIAVVALIGITTLGIFGYLSDAFDKTVTKVSLLESQIVQVEKQIKTHEKEIDKIENAADVVDTKANDSISQYQKIYDAYVGDQRARQDSLRSQMKSLDDAVAILEASPGGLFSSKTKKLKELSETQAADREAISVALLEVDSNIDAEYKRFLTKVENLRETTEQVPDNVEDVNLIYTKIRGFEQEIADKREEIRNTDIGSFKFIARSFDVDLEGVVKWFILIICCVFDPLAVVLVVGLNMMLKDMTLLKPKKVKKPAAIVGEKEIVEVEKIVEVDRPVEVERIVEVEKRLSPFESMMAYWKDRKGGK